MRITIIGTGYVGLTTGATLAELGHLVTCVDKDKNKLQVLKNGEVPFYEPGLKALVQKHLGRNLKFTDRLTSAVKSTAIMIAVGTPPDADGSPDLSSVLEAVNQLVEYLQKYKVIIIKSTVPIGTKKVVEKYLVNRGAERKKFDLISNPEFLREGTAVSDSFHPDRMIIGADSQKAVDLTRTLYQPIECPVMITSNETAEMIKYAANAFLAAKISFVNELSGICEEYGVDVNEVARGIGYDTRIGPHFLKAGAGYGGSCLPKDLSGLLYLAEKADKEALLLKAVRDVNTKQPDIIVEKLERLLGSLKGKQIAVWGLAFKPETDDMRFAPAVPVITRLINKEARISAFDPAAMENAGKLLPPQVEMCADMYETVRGCDALIIMTEWKVFTQADLKLLRETMKNPVIIDGRNIFSPPEMKLQGFLYEGIGR